MCDDVKMTEKHEYYNDQVEIEEIDIAPGLKVLIHRPKNIETDKAFVFFHACGGVAGSARGQAFVANRYAVEGKVVVINVEYGLAPEAKSPMGIVDGYLAVKWASEQGFSSLSMGGASGGAWIAMGVGRKLAQQNETDLVSFMLLMIPQIGDMYVRGEPDSFFTPVELAMVNHNQVRHCIVAKDCNS